MSPSTPHTSLVGVLALSALLAVSSSAQLVGGPESVKRSAGQGSASHGLSASGSGLLSAGATVNLQNVTLNAGSLSLRDFGAAGLRHGSENPFGEPETTLTKRCEVALFTTSYAPTVDGGDLRFIEDELTGEVVVPGSNSPNSFGLNVRAAERGDIDGDAEEEVVVAVAISGGLALYRVDRRANGQYDWALLDTLTSLPVGVHDVTLTLGDFDGDKRDEIAVFITDGTVTEWANASAFYVLNDPQDGGGTMLAVHVPVSDAFGNHASFVGAAADLNADGVDELVVKRQGDTYNPENVRVSVYQGGLGATTLGLITNSQQIHFDPYLGILSANFSAKITVGQFDDDLSDELFLTKAVGFDSGYSLQFTQFNYNWSSRQFDHVAFSSFSGSCNGYPAMHYAYDVCAVDRFGRGEDELAIFRKTVDAGTIVRCIRWDVGTASWSSHSVFSGVVGTYSVDALTLRAGDSDANGAQELFASYCWGGTTGKLVWLYAIEDGSNPSNRRIADYSSSATGATIPATVLPGDYDADGFQIRYTGRTGHEISNPVPITLMVAAPTKAGISQNTGLSGTSYTVAAGSGFESALSTSTTITAKAGVDFEDVTGLFGASAKGTYERETRTTNTESARVTNITGYAGAYDKDVIVFAANLYLVHEYEIVAASIPEAVGGLFTIDQPIGTSVYKWTVPYYNSVVPVQYVIGSELLPHTVGDPDSYRTATEMQALVADRVSWSSPGAIDVGQGGGTNTLGIELAFENTTTKELETKVGAEVSFKAWGVTAEGSFAAGEGSAYTVTTNSSTLFEGVVGDIANPAEYQAWSYQFGLCVYHPWRLLDLLGQPNGDWMPGGYPLTVIDYWTNTTGSAY